MRGRISAIALLVCSFLLDGLYAETRQTEQKAGRTIWDGVYTEDQSNRGLIAYTANCARCHGENLAGTVSVARQAPALIFTPFINRWREDTLDGLYDFIRTQMPQNAPGSLDDQTSFDIMTYIFQKNGFPFGDDVLIPTDLPGIMMVAKTGPKPLGSDAIVLSIGCLTPDPVVDWILTSAVEPVRTRAGNSTTPAEIKTSQAKTLGAQKYQLNNVDYVRPDLKPQTAQGQKVQVKGVLTRGLKVDRITVHSIELLGESCSH